MAHQSPFYRRFAIRQMQEGGTCSIAHIRLELVAFPWHQTIANITAQRKVINMNEIAYALAHIDGELDCGSIKTGVSGTPEHSRVIYFQVIAGLQRHPVYAIKRLATKVYCYSKVAQENGQSFIEINLAANLVSGSQLTCPLAAKITWHTSSKTRAQAEALIPVIEWPSQEIMEIPLTDELKEL